jgi:hypothetical protein
MAIVSTIPSVVTMGFGNGTYAPNVGLLITLGYGVFAVVSSTVPGHESVVSSDRPHSTVPRGGYHSRSPSDKPHSEVPKE